MLIEAYCPCLKCPARAPPLSAALELGRPRAAPPFARRPPRALGGGRGARPIVVYVYFSPSIPDDHYSWATMRLTIKHGNRVVLMADPGVVVPPDLAPRIELVPATEYESADLERFRLAYKPWGLGEPWELNNMLRYFVAYELMVRRKLDAIFYADSDVAVMTQLEPLGNDCDTIMNLERNRLRMQVGVYEHC